VTLGHQAQSAPAREGRQPHDAFHFDRNSLLAVAAPSWDWGGGWNYNPDNLPTGGELFETGAASNTGDYSNATDNANIAATHVAPTHAAEISALFKYENYLAEQLPVVWVPEAPE
jgi:hypothetical protein